MGTAVILGQLVALSAIAIPILEGRDSIIYQQARQMALARARLGAALLEPTLGGLSKEEMKSGLRSFLTSPDIVQARIVQRGVVLAAVTAGVDEAPATVPALAEEGEQLLITTPLGTLDARLEFEFRTTELALQVSSALRRALTLGAAVLAAGLWLAYALSLRSIRQLEHVATVASAIAQGDTSQRLAAGGPDELVRVSESFNAMVDAVEASGRALLETNASLERRVDERTRELVQAQKQLVETERLATVGAMSAQLAHDLRNPLAVVTVNAELIEDEIMCCSCGARARDLVHGIQRSIARADQALAEYLEFARLSRMRAEPADVNELLAAETRAVAAWLESRGVALRLEPGIGVPAAPLDGPRFRMAIRCVMRHAVDAMPGGGALTIATESDAGAVWVRISDTGAPIGEETRKELFLLFHGPRPNSGGPGLRLAREIIRGHGGEVALERSDASGSTFSIRLPV